MYSNMLQATSRSSWGIQRHSQTWQHILYLWVCPQVFSQIDVHLSMQKSSSSPLSSLKISTLFTLTLSMSPDNLWTTHIFAFCSWDYTIPNAESGPSDFPTSYLSYSVYLSLKWLVRSHLKKLHASSTVKDVPVSSGGKTWSYFCH